MEEFYAHPKMADGHLNICKRCVRCRVTNHREENIDRIRAYDRARGSRGGVQNDVVKKKANSAIGNALRDGRVSKKPCVICGNPKSEGHHYDYTKPLDVIWLCPVHHKRLHHRKFSLIPIPGSK